MITGNTLRQRTQEYLILGCLTLAPLVVTLWILWSLVKFLDDALSTLLPSLGNLQGVLGLGIPGLGIVFTFVLLLVVGAITKSILGPYISRWIDALFGHLPVVRGLYGMAKQVSSVFFSKSPTAAFKKVVYVPFPHEGVKSLAFVASTAEEGYSFVFVPTAPNPTSGYVVRYPNDRLEESHMSVDAALQVILSCGAVSKPAVKGPA